MIRKRAFAHKHAFTKEAPFARRVLLLCIAIFTGFQTCHGFAQAKPKSKEPSEFVILSERSESKDLAPGPVQDLLLPAAGAIHESPAPYPALGADALGGPKTSAEWEGTRSAEHCSAAHRDP